MEIVTALILFLNGSMIEHVYKADLKSCNESKEVISICSTGFLRKSFLLL